MAFTLRNILRPGAENDPDDLRTARGALRHAGFFLPDSPPENGKPGAPGETGGADGAMDRALEAALRRFQRANLLEEDAVMRPFGPTMRRLLDLTERAPAPEARRKVRFQTPIPAEAERRNEELRTAFFRRGTGEDFLDLGRRAMLDDQARAVPELIDLADKIAERDEADGERFRALLLDTAQGISPEAAEAVRMGSAGLAKAKGVVRAPVASPAPASETAPILRAAAAEGAAPQATAGPGRLPASPRVTPEGDRARPASPMDRMVARDQKRTRAEQAVPPPQFDLDALAEEQRQKLGIVDLEGEGAALTLDLLSQSRHANIFPKAAAALRHYLHGEGADVDFTPDEALDLKSVSDAAQRIRGQIENAVVGKAVSSDLLATMSRIKALENGEAVQLAPVFLDEDIEQGEVDKNAREHDRWDEKLAIGKTHLASEVVLTARREGDTIFLSGQLDQVWSDPYDFEKNGTGTLTRMALLAERAGRAQPYRRGSGWKEAMTATLGIRGGDLVLERVQWRRTGEKIDWRRWRPSNAAK